MESISSVAAHRHARRPNGVIARARRDAPLQGVPPTAAPGEAWPCASISPLCLSQTALVMQCKELLLRGAAPAAWLIFEQRWSAACEISCTAASQEYLLSAACLLTLGQSCKVALGDPMHGAPMGARCGMNREAAHHSCRPRGGGLRRWGRPGPHTCRRCRRAAHPCGPCLQHVPQSHQLLGYVISLVAGYHAASERPENVGLATACHIPPNTPCNTTILYS